MVNYRKIIISCELFWGFTHFVDLDEIDSIQEIIDLTIIALKDFLKRNNLLNLVDKLNVLIKDKRFHVHDVTFEDVLLSDDTNTVYVCSH